MLGVDDGANAEKWDVRTCGRADVRTLLLLFFGLGGYQNLAARRRNGTDVYARVWMGDGWVSHLE